MSANFLGKKIMIITSHPDDESFLCAGTIHKNFLSGGKTYLICATMGEKGTLHLNKPTTEHALKQRRKKELSNAARFLRVTKLYCFDHPDGGLKKKKRAFNVQCLALAKNIKPEAILSFGPDGITGHLDHITAGQVAKLVAKKTRVDFFAFSLPSEAIILAQSYLNSRKRKNYYLKKVIFEEPNVKITIDPKIKMRAIRFHESQIEKNRKFIGFSKILINNTLRAEYFKK